MQRTGRHVLCFRTERRDLLLPHRILAAAGEQSQDPEPYRRPTLRGQEADAGGKAE